MPGWILIVVIAQFIYAVTAIVDKFILTSKKVSKPFIYAFYVSILSVIPIGLFFLSPFRLAIGDYALPLFENITKPTAGLLAMSIVSAFAGFYALLSLYSALKKADASDVVPVVGSVGAIGTFILSMLISGEILSHNFFFGFVFLVMGTAFVSHFRFNKEVSLLTLHAGFLYAIKIVMMKEMFNASNFDQAFFWSRVGILIVLISLLLIPRSKEKVQFHSKSVTPRGNAWVVGNAILGGIAAFMLLKAVELGSPTIVQALGGLQFVFLMVLSFLFGRVTNRDFGENNRPSDLLQKTVSIVLITSGFFFLFT